MDSRKLSVGLRIAIVLGIAFLFPMTVYYSFMTVYCLYKSCRYLLNACGHLSNLVS